MDTPILSSEEIAIISKCIRNDAKRIEENLGIIREEEENEPLPA